MEIKSAVQTFVIFAFAIGSAVMFVTAFMPTSYAGNITNSTFENQRILFQNHTNNTIVQYFGDNSSMSIALVNLKGASGSTSAVDQIIYAFSAISALAITAGQIALVLPTIAYEGLALFMSMVFFGIASTPSGIEVAAMGIAIMIGGVGLVLIMITFVMSIIEYVTGRPL